MSFENLLRKLVEENESDSSLPMQVFMIGMVILIMVIVGPFVATRERRALCYTRCVERDWSANSAENESPSVIPTLSIMETRIRYVTTLKGVNSIR